MYSIQVLWPGSQPNNQLVHSNKKSYINSNNHQRKECSFTGLYMQHKAASQIPYAQTIQKHST